MDPLQIVHQAPETLFQTGDLAALPERLPLSPSTSAKVLGSLPLTVRPIRKITGQWEAGSSHPKMPGAGILEAGLVAFAEEEITMLLPLVLPKRIIGVVRLVHGFLAAVAAVRVCICPLFVGSWPDNPSLAVDSVPSTPQMGRRKLELLPRSGSQSTAQTPLSSPKMASAQAAKANPFGFC